LRDTVLFDLDGTLLPLDADEFIKIYFGEMGPYFADLIEPEKLVKYVWAGTKAMVENLEEHKTNEAVFMECFGRLVDKDLELYKERFNTFYDTGFLKVRKSVRSEPAIREAVSILKMKGYSLCIATNPLFPKKAILHRIAWAGLDAADFDYISHYEQNCYCKPNIEFYREVLAAIGKKPEQCFMVGNDVQEDMIASSLGIETFLVTNYLINRSDEIVCDHQGDYKDFLNFCSSLPKVV